LVHSTTDSEKSSQRHEIQTTTENSCARWPRRLTSKLTKKPVGGWGAWELPEKTLRMFVILTQR
jgi:hypothetical protein